MKNSTGRPEMSLIRATVELVIVIFAAMAFLLLALEEHKRPITLFLLFPLYDLIKWIGGHFLGEREEISGIQETRDNTAEKEK